MAASNKLPTWVYLWNLASGIICIWDASIIMFRPDSLPGGKLHWIWAPYKLYIEVDTRYKDMGDTFVYCVSLMNYCEVIICFYTLYLHSQNSRRAIPVSFMVNTMIFWKTVLYMLQYTELAGGGEYHAHNDWFDTIFLLWVPNGTWILVPFLVMCTHWNRIVHGPEKVAKTS